MTALATSARDTLPWDSAALTRFEHGRADVLVLDSPLLDGLAEQVATLTARGFRQTVKRSEVDTMVEQAVRRLGLNHPELTEDAARTAHAFLNQFGLAQANLRLELVDKVACPKFHCDYVRLRMIKTYVGPGTELCPANDLESVTQTGTGSIVFLKGSRDRRHRHQTLHRSPEVPAGTLRLCLVLDF